MDYIFRFHILNFFTGFLKLYLIFILLLIKFTFGIEKSKIFNLKFLWNLKIISNTIESNINNSSSSKKNENENVLKLETVQKTSYSELVEISNSPIRNHPDIKVSENEINNF